MEEEGKTEGRGLQIDRESIEEGGGREKLKWEKEREEQIDRLELRFSKFVLTVAGSQILRSFKVTGPQNN